MAGSHAYVAPARWRVAAADATGAVHVARHTHYEDAWAVAPADALRRDGTPVVVAVADGHGHARHFRSARGAEMAVTIATRQGIVAAGEIDRATDPMQVADALRLHIAPSIVDGWHEGVQRDLDETPVSADELAAAGLGASPTAEDLTYAYGTTLLVAVAVGTWLAFLQLGDGDLFLIAPDGTVHFPVPYDPRLDGLRTTSLCQPDAIDSIRYGIVRAAPGSVGAIMLATDGFGNAQMRDDWEPRFAAGLAGLAARRGIEKVAECLPQWVRDCASEEGSGDDVTAVLVLAADAAWEPRHVSAPAAIEAGPSIAPATHAAVPKQIAPHQEPAHPEPPHANVTHHGTGNGAGPPDGGATTPAGPKHALPSRGRTK
ncbi:MAG TPA: protein phosphatase 2C domain-containing protein [Micromonosporaceae bacterium]|jgi:hypothetical protein